MSNGPLPPPMSSQSVYPPPIHPQFGPQPPRPSQPGPPPGMYGAAVPYGQPPSSYPGSYQVGNQLQSYPAGQTNNGMPQGLHSVGPAPGSRASDWQEHTSPDGRRYYYNKRSKLSSWEKPEDLMSPTERADASTVWKEFITGENRKYYFNKVTKISTWTMPDEMKAARDQAERGYPGSSVPPQPEFTPGLPAPSPVPSPSSPAVSLTPAHVPQAPPLGTPSPAPATSENAGSDYVHEPMIQDAEKGASSIGKFNVAPPSEGKSFSTEEPVITYATKTEAKNAFKELLEAMHVQSDWTWDQTMRIVINDKRYGALKTLGERKQAFNEYLAQRKKLEIEEKRLKQKKAREEFSRMLEESKDLTSTSRWGKVMALFEGDSRFHAVEKDREREDLFDDFLLDLERKEREKLREEKRKNRAEFRAFLETCDFIKVNTHWRKVQDKLDDDDRFIRLDKADRLEVFQEYIRDLEKEEEEEKKIQKEQQRRKERKNRDEFRSLLETHKAAGNFNARTQWRDYVAKIKDHPVYQAAASNVSGSTPKELYMDVIEELEKLYHEDKTKIKDIMKSGKISVVATTAYEEFKAGVEAAGDLTGISEVHVKLVFEDAMDRIKEKEEKEAKKRRRLADEFSALLRSNKSITVTSTWEEARPLVEESAEYRAIDDEPVLRKLFDEHIVLLQQKAKDKEKKRDKDDSKSKKEGKEKDEKDRDKEKEKDREKKKDKEKSSSKRDRESEDPESLTKEEKKREKEKRHRRHHKSTSSEDEEDRGEDSKKSRKHSHEHRRSSKKHHESDSEAEAKPKRHKRDRDGRRSGGSEELEDGEVGEDGEIR